MYDTERRLGKLTNVGNTMDYRLSEILGRYSGDVDGDKIRIPCPVHNGKDKNCAVWIDDHDKIAAHCHSHGCAVTQFLWKEFDPSIKRGRVSAALKKTARWLKSESADVFHPPKTWKGLIYKKHWVYFNADRIPINLAVVRYEDPTNPAKKATPPFMFARLDDGRSMWINKGPSEPVWYGLHTLSYSDTVVVVEGEKCAAHASKKLGQDYAVVSWLGGGGKIKDLDLSIFDGKRVILWPDNDEVGNNWAWQGPDNLYDRLIEREIAVLVVDVGDQPEKFDVADIDDDVAIRDLLHNAVSPNKWRLDEIFKNCPAATPLNMTEDMARTIPCGVMDACQQCRFKYIPGIAHPIHIIGADPVLTQHAYITEEHRYVNLTHRQRSYDLSRFNATFAHLPGYAPRGANTAAATFDASPSVLKCYKRDFIPGKPLVHNNILNVWEPITWNVTNEEPEDWLKVGLNWATQDELDYILDHLAWTLVHPEHKINWQVLVRGTTGIGKSLFFGVIMRAFRRANQWCEITESMLGGGFNGNLIGAKVGSIEEVMAASGGYSIENRLKPLAAAPPDTLPINIKHGSQIDISNVISIYAQTNNEVPFKLSNNDRRWFVVDSYLTGARNIGYMTDLTPDKYMRIKSSDEYVDVVLSYLSRRALSDFDWRGNAPESEGKKEIIKHSVPFYRELEPDLDDIEWNDIVVLGEVRDILHSRGHKITQNAMVKVLNAYGWTNLETQIRLPDGTKIRPWVTVRAEMYDTVNKTNLVRDQWLKQCRTGFRGSIKVKSV
jgi:hypothetical protein